MPQSVAADNWEVLKQAQEGREGGLAEEFKQPNPFLQELSSQPEKHVPEEPLPEKKQSKLEKLKSLFRNSSDK